MNFNKRDINKNYIKSNHRIYHVAPGIFVESTNYNIIELTAY